MIYQIMLLFIAYLLKVKQVVIVVVHVIIIGTLCRCGAFNSLQMEGAEDLNCF